MSQPHAFTLATASTMATHMKASFYEIASERFSGDFPADIVFNLQSKAPTATKEVDFKRAIHRGLEGVVSMLADVANAAQHTASEQAMARTLLAHCPPSSNPPAAGGSQQGVDAADEILHNCADAVQRRRPALIVVILNEGVFYIKGVTVDWRSCTPAAPEAARP